MEHFKKHFLAFTLLPLLILTIGSAYVRFMVLYDYEVTHEGFCDPYTESCFMYCEDENCSEPFYYTWIVRQAHSLVNMCGDLTVPNCEAASECAEGEEDCYVTFCNTNNDLDCEYLTESDIRAQAEYDLNQMDVLQYNLE